LLDRVVRLLVEVRVAPRVEREDEERGDGEAERPPEPARDERPAGGRRGQGRHGYTFSAELWPRRPAGRNTMSRIRIPNTTLCDHRWPRPNGAPSLRPWIRPISTPPSTAPVRL